MGIGLCRSNEWGYKPAPRKSSWSSKERWREDSQRVVDEAGGAIDRGVAPRDLRHLSPHVRAVPRHQRLRSFDPQSVLVLRLARRDGLSAFHGQALLHVGVGQQASGWIVLVRVHAP